MTDLDFATMLDAERSDQILISTLHRRLYDPSFAGLTVPIEPWTPHGYDGWFHPSAHATWTVRQLYLYLTRPGLLAEERMPFSGVLAVTVGTFWHRFVQMVLAEDGTLVQDEVPVEDIYTRRRGHVDGRLANGEALEIKTAHPAIVDKITSVELLRARKPEYYGQTQDYLDMLGARRMRYLFLAPQYPFPMSEFVVPADFDYIAKRRVEYRTAVELAERHPDGTLADDSSFAELERCCAPKSAQAKKCPVRQSCPVGRYR